MGVGAVVWAGRPPIPLSSSRGLTPPGLRMEPWGSRIGNLVRCFVDSELGRSRRLSEVRRLVILRLLNLQANQIERNADGRWQGVSCVADFACRRQICRTWPMSSSHMCISTSGRQPLALSSVGVARGRASRHGRHKGNRRLLAKLKARPRASTARRRQSGGRRRGQTPMNGRPPSAITRACLLRSD